MIAWKSPLVTSAVIAAWIVVSLMVKTLSFVSVVAYAGLALIAVATLLRVYATVAQSGGSGDGAHPLQRLLDEDVHRFLATAAALAHSQTQRPDSALHLALDRLRDVLLLHRCSDAAKFFLGNVALVYLGMAVDLTDLLLVATLLLLTAPKLYSLYRPHIDAAAVTARHRVCALVQL